MTKIYSKKINKLQIKVVSVVSFWEYINRWQKRFLSVQCDVTNIPFLGPVLSNLCLTVKVSPCRTQCGHWHIQKKKIVHLHSAFTPWRVVLCCTNREPAHHKLPNTNHMQAILLHKVTRDQILTQYWQLESLLLVQKCTNTKAWLLIITPALAFI